MTSVQCPICKNQFGIQLDISVRTRGLIVFRGKLGFLGNLESINSLRHFIRKTFIRSKRLSKQSLIDRLEKECGIPHSDACHFVQTLQQEGFMDKASKGELGFVG